MIVAGSASPLLLASAAGGYNLTNSLRLRRSASAYLNRLPTSVGNRQIFTISMWVKRGILGATRQCLFSAGTTGVASSGSIVFDSTSADKLIIQGNGGGSYLLNTTQVFRDPSAWYHLVVAFDTPQTTASNRIKVYVNGTQVTTFGTATYPSQNYNSDYNNTAAHNIASRTDDGVPPVSTFDGYITEFNLVDGQALTPSSFGANNASTGVWQPKKYVGTYGTNGFYLPFSASQYGLSLYSTSGTGFSTFAGVFTTSTQVNLPTNSTNLAIGTGDFTIEGWVNTTLNGRGSLIGIGAVNTAGSLWFGWEDNSTTYVRFGTTDVISTGLSLSSTGWVHIAVTRSGSTVRLYKNGSLVASGTSTANLNLTNIATVGGYGATNPSSYTLTGSLSNVRLVVGTALYTGSTYTVPTSALTAVSGTQLLTLQNSTLRDNSANNYTLSVVQPSIFDASGNANNWQTNNINVTTVGVTYDSMTDVPTLTSATAANFCTLNPLAFQSSAPSGGNLNGDGTNNCTATIACPSTGKYYFEMTMTNGGASGQIGIFATTCPITSLTAGTMLYTTEGRLYENDVLITSAWSTFTNGDTVAVAVNMDTGQVSFYKNNTLQGTRSFVSQITSSSPVFAVRLNSGVTASANFGQRPFAYTPPTGFVALNTFNLPTPTIGATASTQANKYFDATLYTGNGGTLAVTNAGGFQPDFVWMKNRASAYFHGLYDSVRGTGTSKSLYSNSTDAEGTNSTNQNLTSFNSNGFSLGSTSSTNAINTNGEALVAWQWRASNATAVTNTAGSITSTVSANTSAGFSVVTYTGTGSNATVGHGLGVAPKMIIVKARNVGTQDWQVYHETLGINQAIQLNLTAAASSATNYWYNGVTSTVFGVNGSYAGVNANTNTYVAYCFAEIAGYSKFGSYTGNGSANGTFVFTGFRPAFIMCKRTDSTGFWAMLDDARGPYNVVDEALYANANNAESTAQATDFTSNGFKFRTTDSDVNSNGGTHIYMAFAENPFKYSLAR